MTHICVGNLTTIGTDHGLSPGWRQAIIWTNAGILLIGPLGTNFSEISIKILTFSFTKMRLKVSSAKWHQFCLGLNVLKHVSNVPLAVIDVIPMSLTLWAQHLKVKVKQFYMPRHQHALWRWVGLGHISVHDQHFEVLSQTPYAAAYIMCQHCVDFTCLTSSLSIFKRLFILLQTLEYTDPDSKVHGANMGPIWGWQDLGGLHVGPMNFAIWGAKPIKFHGCWCLGSWLCQGISSYNTCRWVGARKM